MVAKNNKPAEPVAVEKPINSKYKDYEEGVEYGRIRTNESTELILRQTFYKGQERIDIRTYVTSPQFTGWGKGIVIPKELWEGFKSIISEAKVK